MRFTLALFTGALAALASAQNPFNIPDGGLNVTVGVPLTLSWVPTSAGTVSLYLRDGPNENLNPGIELVTGLNNGGSFTFTPTATNTVPNVAYTVEILDDTNPAHINFTPRFYVVTSAATAENNFTLEDKRLGNEAVAVAEKATGMGSGSGSGAGRGKVCGGVLVLLGCFFVVVM